MSCFKGKMREYRYISIDRFDGENLKSTVFFLSHIHEDHTVGLEKSAFTDLLMSRNDIFLYCSEVTKLLLSVNPKYSHLVKYVKVLPIDVAKEVTIPQPGSCKVERIHVTLLSAAHCPGSVMFLFDGNEGLCLYTGDFRWDSKQITNIAALHENDGKSVRKIDSLYIDTTFCHKSSIYIPGRDDSANAVNNIVTEWIGRGPEYVIHFTPRAQYGHEHLLKEVYLKTGHKIHVKDDKYAVYQQIPGLEDVFTNDSKSTPVHACYGKWNSSSLPCTSKNSPDKLRVLVILPSTMYFTMIKNYDLGHIVIKNGFICRVCYSFHSSYTEVKDFVTYLQPKVVRPNVKPAQDDTIMKVQGRLNEFLKLKNGKAVVDSQRIKPLGRLRSNKFTRKRSFSDGSSQSIEFNFGTPEKSYPPPPKRSKVAMATGDSEDDDHSSYAGSTHEESELSDICESDGEEAEDYRPQSLSMPGQSLLAVLDEHELQATQGSEQEILESRVCLDKDEEQVSAIVMSTDRLQSGEFTLAEEPSLDRGDNLDLNKEDSSESQTDNLESQANDDIETSQKCKGFETLSTPGQSLITALDEVESDNAISNLTFQEKELESCYSPKNSSQKYKIHEIFCNVSEERKQNDTSNNCDILNENEKVDTEFLNKNSIENDIITIHPEDTKTRIVEKVEKSSLEIDSNEMTNSCLENKSTEKDIADLTATTQSFDYKDATSDVIPSTCIIINSGSSSVSDAVLLDGHGTKHVSSKDLSNKNPDKSGSYDLFGSDESDVTDDCDDDDVIMGKIVFTETSAVSMQNGCASKNNGVNRDDKHLKQLHHTNGKRSEIYKKQISKNKACIILDSDEEEERSLLSGKKSLSRGNSFQNGNSNEKRPNILPSDVIYQLNGKGEQPEILSDSDTETIPPSQLSDVSVETMSPFSTPVKVKPQSNPIRSRRSKSKSPQERLTPKHRRGSNSRSSQEKSPSKLPSILPYLSPVKRTSPRQQAVLPSMFIVNGNESEATTEDDITESSTIDLTCSSDEENEVILSDEMTQDYYVID